MTSLVPGCLFNRTGLNKKHTPTPATITSDELDKRYAREEFNGRPWPPSSPVSGVYDIRNTSTKLILINNKRKKASQLRGKSDPRKEEHRYPEPERHSRCSTPVNRENHSKCLDSSSPYYEPEIEIDMDWLNRSQRPQNRFASGSAVNPRRHTSCQVPSDPRAFDIRLHPPRSRPNSRTSLPVNFGRGPIMGQRDMTLGEQRYFNSITRVYSCNQMIRLKRRQYIDILNQELAKGLYTKKEYERYRDYIALGRQRQYIQVQSRSMSAPLRRSTDHQNDTDRSISSVFGDDKSSAFEDQDKSSPERTASDQDKSSPERTASSNDRRRQAKGSGTPNKRPASVKSNSSKRSTVSGRTSPGKSSRSTSAKSTSSTKSQLKNVEHSEEEKRETSSDVQEQEHSENDKEIQNSKTSKGENDDIDSDTNLPIGLQYSAREGHDRPKSRLGHIPEDANENKENKKPQDEKDEQKSQDDNSVSTISLDNTNVETKENATQQVKDENNTKQTNTTSQSRDDDSSSEEEKDPDKLQY